MGAAESEPSLLVLIERWLERTPFLADRPVSPPAAPPAQAAKCPHAVKEAMNTGCPHVAKAPAGGGGEGKAATSKAQAPRSGAGSETFDFWEHYAAAVRQMLERDRECIIRRSQRGSIDSSIDSVEVQLESGPPSPPASQPDPSTAATLAELKEREEHWNGLLDADRYEELRTSGKVGLSHIPMPMLTPTPTPTPVCMLTPCRPRPHQSCR